MRYQYAKNVQLFLSFSESNIERLKCHFEISIFDSISIQAQGTRQVNEGVLHMAAR